MILSELNNIEKAITSDNPIRFNNDFNITGKSKYSDDKWIFIDESNENLNNQPKHYYTINWYEINEKNNVFKKKSNQEIPLVLPETMIEDLKLFIATYYKFPVLFKNKYNSGKQKKENTVVAIYKELARFFSHIYLSSKNSLGFSRFRYLSDITFSDLEEGLKTYPYNSENLYCLKFLCNSHVSGSYIHGSVKWNENDINNLNLDKRKHSLEPTDTIPEELFALLSNSASDLISEFIYLMNGNNSENTQPTQNQLRDKYICFKEMFNDIVYFTNNIIYQDKKAIAYYHRCFKKKFGITVDEFMQTLYIIQAAAITLIFLYTGMRLNEMMSLKKGCIETINDTSFIKGTVTKGKPSNLPANKDKWIATYVVIQAIKTLEELTQINNSNYLFSRIRDLEPNYKRNTYSKSVARPLLNNFLRHIDKNSEWKGYNLNPHKFRHTLVELLQKADVGLPYITIQLKHLHHKLTVSPNQVTASYGNYKENRIHLLKDGNKGKFHILSGMYSEKVNLSGGGAEKLKENSKAFFTGIALSGKELEKYLKELSKNDIQFIPTGLGICTMNWSDIKQVKDLSPPCLKDSTCKSECTNNVITTDILPNLKGRLKDVENKLKDSEYSYLKDTLISKKDKLIMLIKELSK